MGAHKIRARFPPLFDPRAGQTVLAPEANGAGYWVGAPTVVFDESLGFLLCYRRRRPRGVDPDRGYTAVIARSKDGFEFQDIWQITKGELDSTSIEKCSILRGRDGVYRYYMSYVDPADQRWRTDVIEARSPDAFDVAARREVFTAASASRAHDAPVEGVKDPVIYLVGGIYYLFLSIAAGTPPGAGDRTVLHATADVFNTGLLTAPSALATSTDGVHFRWRGECLRVGEPGSWHAYQARLNSVLRHDGLWYGFYDGAPSHEENYEEKCGLAQSFDLQTWEKITDSGPLVTVPWSTGSVRYTEALRVGPEIRYYYEMVREDGAHELRCAVAAADGTASSPDRRAAR